MKNKYVAALLAIFFGTLGIHKFYLKDSGGGIFYIMIFFFTINMFDFPISALLGFIDAFRLFGMSKEKFDKKYNKHALRSRSARQTKRYKPPTARRTVRTTETKTVNRSKSNPFKRTGIAKYKDYDIEGAIEDFKKGLEVDQNDLAIHFNLACAYSLEEQADKSFYHIDRAVSLGFKDFEKIRTKDDLAFMRIQKEFDHFQENGFRLNPSEKEKANPQQNNELLSQLNKLSELRKKGYLSEEQYDVRKEELLNR